MVNEEKVRLMTHMAVYETHEGKHNTAIGSYFRSDYIGFEVLKSIIAATAAFLLVFGIYIMYNFESLIFDIYTMDLVVTGRKVIFGYLGVVGVYTVISYIVFAIRYKSIKHRLKEYYLNLRELSELYDE